MKSQDKQSNQDGKFRRREQPFTMVSQNALRSEMSLKAKGLYAIIQLYINLPNFTLYKKHLKKESQLGDFAFQKPWNELKDFGYLKQFRVSNNGRWEYEYELLEIPDLSTPSLQNVVNTGFDNLDEINSHAPQKPSYGKSHTCSKNHGVENPSDINIINKNNIDNLNRNKSEAHKGLILSKEQYDYLDEFYLDFDKLFKKTDFILQNATPKKDHFAYIRKIALEDNWPTRHECIRDPKLVERKKNLIEYEKALSDFENRRI